MTDPLAEIRFRAGGDSVVVMVTGEIDLSNAEDLHDRITGEVGAATDVIVDLTDVGYLDSQGIRLLQRLSQQTSLTVVAPDGSVAGDALAMTGMTGVMRVVPSVPE